MDGSGGYQQTLSGMDSAEFLSWSLSDLSLTILRAEEVSEKILPDLRSLDQSKIIVESDFGKNVLFVLKMCLHDHIGIPYHESSRHIHHIW